MNKTSTAVAALVALTIVIIIAYALRAKHQKEGMHGLRHQQYEDNPYNGQTYHCGYTSRGYIWPCAGSGSHESFAGVAVNAGGVASARPANDLALVDAFPYGE